MSVLLTKSLVGLGVGGAVSLGGYGLYSYVSSSRQTLADSLVSQGLVLLDIEGSNDDSIWATNVTNHDSQTPKLSGYEKVETEDKDAKNKQAMKDACKKLLFTLAKDKTKDMEDQAKKWCTKVKTSG